MFAKEDEEYGKGKSKIWLALNPQRLYKETGREKAERQDEDVCLFLFSFPHARSLLPWVKKKKRSFVSSYHDEGNVYR